MEEEEEQKLEEEEENEVEEKEEESQRSRSSACSQCPLTLMMYPSDSMLSSCTLVTLVMLQSMPMRAFLSTT